MKKLFGVLLIAALPLAMVPSVAAQAHPAAKKAKVAIVSFQFNPSTKTVPLGTTVIWTNKATIPHGTASDDGTSWNSGIMAPGTKFKHKFTTAGTFTYHCVVHAFMTATVIVTP